MDNLGRALDSKTGPFLHGRAVKVLLGMLYVGLSVPIDAVEC